MGGNPRLSGRTEALLSLNRRNLMFSLACVPNWGFSQAMTARPAVRLPGDFGAHPGERTEWWYVTGWLAAAGRTWGFQVTFFRTSTGIAAGHPSRFAARELVFGHAALTDLAAGRHLHAQRVARAGFGIASAAEGRTDVRLRDWHLVREGPVDRGRYTTEVAGPEFKVMLTLETTQPPLLQGEAGWSRKGADPAHFSLYYSEPQLAVLGTLEQQGRRTNVTGRAWLDHEWSTALMEPGVVGWDWIGMNLDDGRALTAAQLRRADGSAAFALGSIRTPGEAPRSFAAHEVVFTPGRRWTSPASQARYPVEWTIDTPAGQFHVATLLDAQELDSRGSTGAWYWEGISQLNDAQGRRLGLGYLEMTGYASRLVL
jgi:predicted secreted hydrolase